MTTNQTLWNSLFSTAMKTSVNLEEGYTLGFNDTETCYPDTSNYEEGYKEGFKSGYRKGEIDTDNKMQREIHRAYDEGYFACKLHDSYDRF